VLIRTEDDGSAIAIGQASHAWISGQLARAWGNDEFGAVEPWEEVCLGAEQHDVGWAEWDRRPALNVEIGLPHTFIDLPIEPKIELWSGAAKRLVTQSRYAAVLVSMHGTGLFERFWPPGADPELQRRFLESERAFQDELLATLDADPDEVRRNHLLVRVWDSLSLALCLGWGEIKVEQVPAAGGLTTLELKALGGGRADLDPWPFSRDAVGVHAEGRRLDGRFDSEPDLHAALDAAPWLRLEFELVRRPRG
jgi:Protein of unknown function (DUF3891)